MSLYTFEGVDGVGKTTLVRAVGEALAKGGVKVVVTKEPTSLPLGEYIRKLFADNSAVDPVTLSLLFMADRTAHCEEIRNYQAKGYTVLCDRYLASTFVYQYLMTRDTAKIDIAKIIAPLASVWVIPTATFLLNAPIDVVLKRLEVRAGERSDFEKNVQRVTRAHEFYRHLKFYMRNSAISDHYLGQVWQLEADRPTGVLVSEVLSVLRTQGKLPIPL